MTSNMFRAASLALEDWLKSSDRLPLILRGARQVGKTWLVRHLAEVTQKQLIELNFEKDISLSNYFDTNDPDKILKRLQAALNVSIDPQNTILFLDEIQASPELIAKLRWFAEELKSLPVIAAGSLLEFSLGEFSFSMPVGRIQFQYIEPLSFEEFLIAKDRKLLLEYLQSFEWNSSIPQPLHQQLMNLFKEYIIVGGLPSAVQSWINEESPQQINKIHNNLLTTYRDDFNRYRGRIGLERFEEIINAVPKLLSRKFTYTEVNRDIQSLVIKQALTLIQKARICHRVMCTDANGLPLKAEIDEKRYKEIFLDVGLCSALLGLQLHHLDRVAEINLFKDGGIAEQVTGQLLRTINPPYIDPELFYWHREKKQSNAEVDYVIQHGNTIIPIEVKAGATGTLRSLHILMSLRKLSQAVYINSNLPQVSQVSIQGFDGNSYSYKLYSLPFYLIGQLQRLLDIKN